MDAPKPVSQDDADKRELVILLQQMVSRFDALREIIGCTGQSELSKQARAAIAKATWGAQ